MHFHLSIFVYFWMCPALLDALYYMVSICKLVDVSVGWMQWTCRYSEIYVVKHLLNASSSSVSYNVGHRIFGPRASRKCEGNSGQQRRALFFFLASNHLVQIIVSLVIFSVEPNVHINVILPTVDIALFQCGLIEKTIHCTSLQDTLSHLVRSNIAVLTVPENSLVISARHNTVIYTLLFLMLE